MTSTTDQIIAQTAPKSLIDHNLVDADVESLADGMIRYEKRPAKRRDGSVADGLFNAWIVLNNPAQYNSYTTDMVKAAILAFRRAAADREVNAVVFTGTGDKAFCTGGNTKEYAEYYAGNPQEYRQYMRLFNDMVSAILGLRQAGHLPGQRHAHRRRPGDRHGVRLLRRLRTSRMFGQAGPKHGSAPRSAAATDFLPRDDRLRAGDGLGHALRTVLGAQSAIGSASDADIVPALKSSTASSSPTRPSSPTACSTSPATCRARRVQDRRRVQGRPGEDQVGRGSTSVAARPRRSRRSAPSCSRPFPSA